MNAVQKAKRRLSSYPDAFLRCSKQAAQYGKCVATADDLKVHDCTRQFQQLKICIQKHPEATGESACRLQSINGAL
ncbi:NADH dehydrogenase [ubiquinone] 1 alpha subcomplex assembly factor 8-like [Dermacentor andersoni]|uniref:NADH dehydrogenase [ubiquinone] 1 alpha subcomplex assembly factor 8-like n=1 Tax=Dermacentor andersoni TaxID=34620 RepID=UPI003B3ACD7F